MRMAGQYVGRQCRTALHQTRRIGNGICCKPSQAPAEMHVYSTRTSHDVSKPRRGDIRLLRPKVVSPLRGLEIVLEVVFAINISLLRSSPTKG